MGFFNKMFGGKVADETGAAEPRSADFSVALVLHLHGDVEPAFAAYSKICKEQPDDTLAQFFSAALVAATGNVNDAAERLRSLSHRIFLEDEAISFAVSRDLFALLGGDTTLKVPAIAEIIITFGDGLKKASFVQESLVCFEIAASLLPERANVLHKLGDTLHDLRQYEYAESVLLKAVEYSPNHWGALYTYAVLLQDLGRFPEAISYYEKAVKLNPDHVNCQNNYGAALMMTNRLEEALEHCTLAARLDRTSPWPKINLGNIYSLMQDYETARACYTEAISLNSSLAPAYYGLGSVEQLLGSDSGKVRELYQTAVKLNPMIPDVHHALGNLLAGEGDREALAYFAVAAQMNPGLRNLQRDFGSACLQLGRRDEGVEHLRLAIQQNPDDGMARDLLSREEQNPAGAPSS
jgi:tetratricopeptide (TPR) repeat protein